MEDGMKSGLKVIFFVIMIPFIFAAYLSALGSMSDLANKESAKREAFKDAVCLFGSSKDNDYKNDTKGIVKSGGGSSPVFLIGVAGGNEHNYCLYPDGTMKDFDVIKAKYELSVGSIDD